MDLDLLGHWGRGSAGRGAVARVLLPYATARDLAGFVCSPHRVSGCADVACVAADMSRIAIDEPCPTCGASVTLIRFGDRFVADAQCAALGPRRLALVYFAHDPGRGEVKIGHTIADPAERLRTLQVGRSTDLVLLGSEPGSRGRERDLHRRFAHLHVNREWFRYEGELLDYIGALRGGGSQ